MTRLAAALAGVVGCGVVAAGAARTLDPAAIGPDRALAAASAETPPARFDFEQPHMGTTARVVLYAPNAAKALRLADRAFARIVELDARLSDYRHDSELMVLCRAAGGPPVVVSEDLYAVLSAAQRLSRRTDGEFDVSVGPLSRLWRRARVTGEPPTAENSAAAKALVGYEQIELSDRRAVRLAKPGMLLDLGGIAKGYAADQAAAVLRAHGASRALVAIGGDIVAGEAPPGKQGWSIAVAPLGPRVATEIPPVTLRYAALSTSGDAEQYVEQHGTRHSHILTPRTGDAVRGRRGATVLARDGITADGLATALSVMETGRGLALIDSTPGAAAFILEGSPAGVRAYRSTRWQFGPE